MNETSTEKNSFTGWLANLLHQSESDVKRILKNEDALHFLIAWSLFEAKCFSGFMRSSDIDGYSTKVSTQDLFDSELLREAASHFHARYQDDNLLKRLSHRDKISLNMLKPMLTKRFELLGGRDLIFLIVLVIYRFRNNMFHGNKKVQSWLHFSEQIRHCTKAMQLLISHAEVKLPTMRDDCAKVFLESAGRS